MIMIFEWARHTVAVIATYFRLDGPWIGSLCETRYSVPVQTGCGPPSLLIGSGSLTLG
jgi:hypothetical protein